VDARVSGAIITASECIALLSALVIVLSMIGVNVSGKLSCLAFLSAPKATFDQHWCTNAQRVVKLVRWALRLRFQGPQPTVWSQSVNKIALKI